MPQIDGNTKVYGLFGYPVSHTFSPAMHNAAFQKLKFNSLYLSFSVRPDQLRAAVTALRTLGICGVNLTIPHKEMVVPYLDELSREAKLIGAVNTIVVNEDRLIGHNTDGRGFLLALKRGLHIDAKKKSIFVIGAGGAAKAIAFQLALEGVREIFITDIAQDRAHKLVSALNKHIPACHAKFVMSQPDEVERTVADADILVNATPIGMKDTDPLLLSARSMHSKLVVCDVIYNPTATKLLRAAKGRGLKTMNGLGMLLYQGAMSFYLWTKKEPPVDVMRQALLRQMRGQNA